MTRLALQAVITKVQLLDRHDEVLLEQQAK